MQLPKHEFYNCVVTTDDGSKHFVDANWFHNNDLDQWKGWRCCAGSDRIFIDPTGNVYSGECCNDHLGHIETGWKLLDQATVCSRDRCTGCTDDLLISKEI